MDAGSSGLSYVVITPARNEGKYIRRTAESMVSQTRPPLRWVVVSDGSTDDTDDIVNEFSRKWDWILLQRLPEHGDRSFAAKVRCFDRGLQAVENVPFDLIASLDADISFDSGYFDTLVAKFAAHPHLGVAGTPFVEGDQQYDYRFTNIEHVSGACQMFRRECFEDIGGYVGIEGGGVDWTAVTTARMKGWQTRTFTDKTCLHLRPMGSASRSRLTTSFHHGQKDYYLGGHPIWQLFRAGHQATRPPYVFAGCSLLAGYTWAWLKRVKRPVPPELVQFHRREQMDRLKRFFRKAGDGVGDRIGTF